jgi:hypothetical protein
VLVYFNMTFTSKTIFIVLFFIVFLFAKTVDFFAIQFAPSEAPPSGEIIPSPQEAKDIIQFDLVVKPWGYVYRRCWLSKLRCAASEKRIKGAKVTLYQFNEETGKWQRWPAEDYDQKNPQFTNEQGEYGFMVPEGKYFLRVAKDGYLTKEIKPLKAENNLINLKVGLISLGEIFTFLGPLLGIIILLFFLFILRHRKLL